MILSLTLISGPMCVSLALFSGPECDPLAGPFALQAVVYWYYDWNRELYYLLNRT